MSTYPNPASDYIELSSSIPAHRKGVIRITDLPGNIVTVIPFDWQKGNNTTRIDLQNFSSGVYFIEVRSPEGLSNSKFVKN